MSSHPKSKGSLHTPGPWGATTRQGSWDWVVYQKADPNIEICQPFHDGTEFNEIGEANARLIAAAPDSHEANRMFVRAVYAEHNIPANASDEFIYDTIGSAMAEAFFSARAAIAKATGA